jgi:hypothetical protein
MRLAFCTMSNNIERITEMDRNFNYHIYEDNNIVSSYTKNLLTNPPVPEYFYPIKWNCQWKIFHTNKPLVDYFSLRQASIAMADDADLIFIFDDDFVFLEESISAINQLCYYMFDNQDCGAIYCGGNWGEEGKEHGDEIFITNKGHLNTNRGILVRNGPLVMYEEFHGLGACEDWAIGFTCLMHGNYIARRLHFPIMHRIERNTLEVDHKNINYDIGYILTKGVLSQVMKVTKSKFDLSGEWPSGIWQMYRRMAMTTGQVPKYDVNGNII